MIKLLRDSWLVAGTALRTRLRNPMWVLIGLFQPICYMLLFAPLLKNLGVVPGFPKGRTYNVFTPGLMFLMAIFGAGFAGFNVIERLREGVIERWRVTPVSRLAMMIGIVVIDLINLTIQVLVLLVIGLLLGFSPDVRGMIILMGLLLLAGLMMASCSYALALVLKDEGSLAGTVNLFALPLMLLSGVFLPITLAPDILQNISKGNPFTYAITAGRALVNGSLGDVAIMQALAILVVAAVLALFWATQSIRKAAM